MLHQPLAEVVAGERQRIVGTRLAHGGGGRGQLLENVVEQPLVEGKALAQGLGADVGRDLGRDADRALFELQVDRQGELLGNVVGIQLERPLGRPERPVELAEV